MGTVTAIRCVSIILLCWGLAGCGYTSPKWAGLPRDGLARERSSRPPLTTPARFDMEGFAADTLTEIRNFISVLWPSLQIDDYDVTTFSAWEDQNNILLTIPQTENGMMVDNANPYTDNSLIVGMDRLSGEVWGVWNNWSRALVDTVSYLISIDEARINVKHRFPALRTDWNEVSVTQRVLTQSCTGEGRITWVFDLSDDNQPGISLRVYVDGKTGAVIHWRTLPVPQIIRWIVPPRKGRETLNRASIYMHADGEMATIVSANQSSWWEINPEDILEVTAVSGLWGGLRLRAYQTYRGRPVAGGRLEFFADERGFIRAVNDSWRAVNERTAYIPSIDTSQAVFRATLAYPGYGVGFTNETTLGLYSVGEDEARLVWVVRMRDSGSLELADETLVYVDAHTDRVVDYISISCHPQWFQALQFRRRVQQVRPLTKPLRFFPRP